MNQGVPSGTSESVHPLTPPSFHPFYNTIFNLQYDLHCCDRMDIWTDKQADRQWRDRQREGLGQTDRQTDGQTDRQT